MEQSRFPRSILDHGFPEGFVAGMVEVPASVPRVIEALEGAGLSRDDVRVLPGGSALEIDASHHPSLATAPARPGERAASEEFVAGALLGDVLVGVRARSDDRARRVARVLWEEGVRCVYHFDRRTVHPPQELARLSA